MKLLSGQLWGDYRLGYRIPRFLACFCAGRSEFATGIVTHPWDAIIEAAKGFMAYAAVRLRAVLFSSTRWGSQVQVLHRPFRPSRYHRNQAAVVSSDRGLCSFRRIVSRV